MGNELMVSICCLSYNHEKYLRQCLEGFVMQQTDFNYEIIIHDDASTDSSQEIIKEYANRYPSLFRPILQKENQYSKGGGILHRFVVPNAKGKYIALCEGDDYWTDPLKLQKQVDFMENHSDFSMCFHKVNVISDPAIKTEISFDLEQREYSPREIFEKWVVPTCSVLYRKECYKGSRNKNIFYGDIYTWLLLSESGRIYCLGFVGGVYNRHIGGLSVDGNVEKSLALFRQYKYMAKRFPTLRDIAKKKQLATIEQGLIQSYYPSSWKYRLIYMWNNPKLFFSSFFTTTILTYSPIKYLIGKK